MTGKKYFAEWIPFFLRSAAKNPEKTNFYFLDFFYAQLENCKLH